MSQVATTSKIEPIIALCERYKEFGPFPMRAWIKLPDFRIEIYIRRTKRHIDGQIEETLDLASFEIEETFRGKGMFSEMLGLVEDYAFAEGLTIFVESVLNERLRGFLSRRGYKTSEVDELCYYKRKPE